MSSFDKPDTRRIVEVLRREVEDQQSEALSNLGLEKCWRISPDSGMDQSVEFLLGVTPSGEYVCFDRDEGDDEWSNRKELTARSYDDAVAEVRKIIEQE